MITAFPHTPPAGTVRVIVALAVGLTVGLTACTDTPAVAPDPSGTTPSSAAAQPDPAPTSEQTGTGVPATPPAATAPVAPEGDASQGDTSGIARAVEAELTTLAGGDRVTSDGIRAAIEQGFAEAGAAPASVEVSIDSTPTGLDVDAIQGAGLIDGSCVFGEVREGTVTVAVLPALASGLCFVGGQR